MTSGIVRMPPYVINPDRQLVTAWGFTGSTAHRKYTIPPVTKPIKKLPFEIESQTEMS